MIGTKRISQFTLCSSFAALAVFAACGGGKGEHRVSGTIQYGKSSSITISMIGTSTRTGTTRADPRGDYTDYAFDPVPDGRYMVRPLQDGATFEPVSEVVVVAGADVRQNFTLMEFAGPLYTISGQVTFAGDGLADVVIALSGLVRGTALTDSAGRYTFANLPVGSYEVRPTQAGTIFDPTCQVVKVTDADVSQDFSATAHDGPTYAISGRAVLAGKVRPGVTIKLSGAASGTSMTDSAGAYVFGGLASGSYVVEASPGNHVFTPESQPVTVADSDISVQDFSAVPGRVSVYAGTPSAYGNLNGTGARARFLFPRGLAVDRNGTVYVTDSGNHRIQKITPEGVVTTLATLSAPSDLALDGTGFAYVVQAARHVVEKIDLSNGQVAAFAGQWGQEGSENGTGADAQFSGPVGVALDQSGNVYVADYGNHTVRKITPGGEVSTLAGAAGQQGSRDGVGTEARFDQPADLAVDRDGNIYVVEGYLCTLRKITPGGVVTTLAGSPGQCGSHDGSGANAQFFYPTAVDVDQSGIVYVTERFGGVIRKVTPDGSVTSYRHNRWGFSDLAGVAVDQAGAIYAADWSDHSVWKLVPDNESGLLAGGAGSWSDSKDGTGVKVELSHPTGHPTGLALDGDGNMYVADTNGQSIWKLTWDGKQSLISDIYGESGAHDAAGAYVRVEWPKGVAVDKNDNLYVTQGSSHCIQMITPAGLISTIAGDPEETGSDDRVGTAARFTFPDGVAVDGDGYLYVADRGNCTIRKILLDGQVTTLAGSAELCGLKNGVGAEARFSQPTGVAVDGEGNVYVADTGNGLVRKITPDGTVSQFGEAGLFFDQPSAVAVDEGGNVYVTDTGHATIDRITPSGNVSTVVGLEGWIGNLLGPPTYITEPYGVAIDAKTGALFFTISNAVLVAY